MSIWQERVIVIPLAGNGGFVSILQVRHIYALKYHFENIRNLNMSIAGDSKIR